MHAYCGPAFRGGHGWPYLELPTFQERQQFVARWMEGSKPRRVLDIGAYFNPLERFARFDRGWCPELLLSVELITPGLSYSVPCGDGTGRVHVVHVPMTIREAVSDPFVAGTQFDAIVCIGCMGDHGLRASELEGWPRPFQLFLEYPPSHEGSFKHFGGMPFADDATILSHKEWQMPAPPAPLSAGYTNRHLWVIDYPDSQ